VITVTDTGEGIPAEHLGSIFDRFYKVDSARGAGAGGSGLGLSIVKTTVERHGGRITVESRPGHGSTFKIELPTSGDSESAPARPGEGAPVTLQPFDLLNVPDRKRGEA